MKKTILSMALVGLLGFTSCNSDDDATIVNNTGNVVL